MPVKITFSCAIKKGETIFIIGENSALGHWNIAEGLRLQGSPIGKATIKLRDCTKLVFKACKYSNSNYCWEFSNTALNRTVDISHSVKLELVFEFDNPNMKIMVWNNIGKKNEY